MDLNKLPKESGTPDKAAMIQQELANLNRNSGINADEFDHAAKKREQQEMLDRSVASGQRFAQQIADARGREDAKLDYARRSAEASEAALEAEKTRTADAKADAVHAREEARISRRNMRISLWFAAGSLLVAAWPFIKEAFGL